MKLQMILKDGSTVDLVEAGLTKHYVVNCQTDDDFVAIWQKMTPENVSDVQITEDGKVTQRIEGMELDGTQTVENADGTVTGHFYLKGGNYKADEYAEAGKILLGESEV